MTEQPLFSRQSMILMRLSLYLLAVASLLGSSPSFISYANAQNGAVTVDLSVIQDGGLTGFGHASRSGLLIPPKSNPTSQLHVAPQNAPRLKAVTAKRNVTLTQPNSTQTKLAVQQPVKAPTAPAPKPMPLKKVAKAPGQSMRIAFDEKATKLPDSMKDYLRKLADGLHDKKDLSLRLMAYADAEGLSASKARRLSLSRALSVCSFLIESGVRSTRIGVMALGSKTPDNPKNRVDISIAKR